MVSLRGEASLPSFSVELWAESKGDGLLFDFVPSGCHLLLF